MSKWRSSTFFCAPSMRRLTMRLSMASPSCMPRRVSMFLTHSPAKIRIRSSSSDRKKRLVPGSPWRPQRPRSCRSMRRASWRSVPITCRPPSCLTSSPFGLHLLALFDLGDQLVPVVLRNVEPRGVLDAAAGPRPCLGIAAQDDVGAAAGHVGGDGHGAFAAGLGDDLGLALVILGVQHFVLDAAAIEHVAEQFALFDRDGADQDRAAAAMQCYDLVAGDCRSLRVFRLELDAVVLLFDDRADQLRASFSSSTSHLCIRSISSTIASHFSRSLR